MSEDLIINIENGVIDFNKLLQRVKDLEETMLKIKDVVETIDEEITYLIKQDNKTGEILLNHAEAVKALREHLKDYGHKKLKIEVVDAEEVTK